MSEEPLPGEAKVFRACLNERCVELDYAPGSACTENAQEPLRLSFCVHSPSYVVVRLEATVGEPFADGDTFDLTVRDDSGQIVIEETRQIEYTENVPNSEECGPRCLDSFFEL